MASVTIILTCFNRKKLTVRCIEKLNNTNENSSLSFIVVDDNSTDGTKEALQALSEQGVKIHAIFGDGNLYWAGGMRKGIEYALNNTKSDFYLFVNDDVDFEENIIDKMVRFFECEAKDSVLVGACRGADDKLTYGGIKYTGRGVRYEYKGIDFRESCDTFNMNCVLIPQGVFFTNGNFDPAYVHSLADFDYGLSLSKRGIPIIIYNEYVGICEKNSKSGTWEDTTLSVKKRIRLKESKKGAPFRTWFHFLYKNFGLVNALLHGFTPYIRILLGK